MQDWRLEEGLRNRVIKLDTAVSLGHLGLSRVYINYMVVAGDRIFCSVPCCLTTIYVLYLGLYPQHNCYFRSSACLNDYSTFEKYMQYFQAWQCSSAYP